MGFRRGLHGFHGLSFIIEFMDVNGLTNNIFVKSA